MNKNKILIWMLIIFFILGMVFTAYSGYKESRNLRKSMKSNIETIENLRENIKILEDDIFELEEEITKIDKKINIVARSGKEKIDQTLNSNESNPEKLIEKFNKSWGE